MKNTSIYLALLTAVLLIFSSCSTTNDVVTNRGFQKRKYQRGWFVNHHQNNSKASSTVSVGDERSLAKDTSIPVGRTVVSENPVSSEVHSEQLELSHVDFHAFVEEGINTQLNESGNISLDECDQIIKENGDIVEAKILEVGVHEVRFKHCDTPNGPLIVLSKSDIFMIKYSNGVKEVIEYESPEFQEQRRQEELLASLNRDDDAPIERKTEGLGLAGFIIGLVSMFTPISYLSIAMAILAIIFGATSLGKHDRTPENYKGKGFAIASLIFGFIGIAVTLILIAGL